MSKQRIERVDSIPLIVYWLKRMNSSARRVQVPEQTTLQEQKRSQPPDHARSGWRETAHDQGQEHVVQGSSRGRDDSRDVVDNIVSTQVAGSRDDSRVLRAADSRRGGLYGDGDGTPTAGR